MQIEHFTSHFTAWSPGFTYYPGAQTFEFLKPKNQFHGVKLVFDTYTVQLALVSCGQTTILSFDYMGAGNFPCPHTKGKIVV